MKSIHATSAVFALVAAVSAGTASANPVPLFSFDNEAVFSTPSFGTSGGLVIVDDGTLTSTTLAAGTKRQLLLDTQGTSDFTSVKGSYFVPAIPVAISYFQYGFTVGSLTEFQFTYNFLTSLDRNSGDFFVAALFNAANMQTNLASEASTTSALFASSSGYLYETGTKYVSFTVGPGTYSTEFIVGTNQAGCLIGGLCVPTGAILNRVPEPTTLALVSVALLGMTTPWRRRKPLLPAA